MSGPDIEADPGTVYLVGSGPGDPDLLTVKANRLLEESDVVLHDKLPGPEIIETLPRTDAKTSGSAPAASARPSPKSMSDWSNSPARASPSSG